MQTKRILLYFTIVALALAVTAGVFANGQSQKSTAPAKTTSTTASAATQQITLDFEPATTERFDTCYWSPGGYANLIFSSLIFDNEDLIPTQGDLAQKWVISNGGTTYTFYLRKGLTFQDGVPLTTQDVAWTFKTAMKMGRILNGIKRSLMSIQGAQAYVDGKASDVSGIKIINPTTIQITVNQPTATFLNGLSAAYILPEHLLKGQDPALIHQSSFWMKPIGSGPYKIVDRSPGDYTILKAFDNYYAGKPKIPTVVFRTFDNPVPAFEAGKLDFMYTTSFDWAKELMSDKNLTVHPVGFAYLRFMAIRVDDPPFNDLRVRKALYLAIDRNAIAQKFFQGYAVAINTNMYPGFWVDKNLKPYPYDPAEAKKLLKEAGWKSNRTIDMIYYYNDQQTRELMSTIQYYWSQVGVKCEPRLVTGDVTNIIQNVKNYDIWYGATGCSDPNDHLGRWTSNYNTGTGFKNAEYDKLLAQETATLDPNKRKVIIDQMQKILYDQIPVIPLYSPDLFFIQSNRIQRPPVYPHGKDWHVNYQWEKWTIVK